MKGIIKRIAKSNRSKSSKSGKCVPRLKKQLKSRIRSVKISVNNISGKSNSVLKRVSAHKSRAKSCKRITMRRTSMCNSTTRYKLAKRRSKSVKSKSRSFKRSASRGTTRSRSRKCNNLKRSARTSSKASKRSKSVKRQIVRKSRKSNVRKCTKRQRSNSNKSRSKSIKKTVICKKRISKSSKKCLKRKRC